VNSRTAWGEQIDERRRRPKDDPMTRLVEVELADDDGVPQRLTDDEIRAFCMLLATAGNETVTKLLATALHELARHPDERRFAEPDRFDVRRQIELHLGFGYGRHICLGASLARLESRVGLEEFLRRWPEYEVPPDGIERMHSSNVRGFADLAIETA
jgi:cytochrome P450